MTGIARKIAWIAAVVVLALTAASCTSGTTTVKSAGNGGKAKASARPSPRPTPRYITITPGAGTSGADPSAGISVTTRAGTLTDVTVHSANAVPGSYNDGKTAWHSTWALPVSQSYTVTATASVNGQAYTQTSSFRTLTPSATFTAQILEGYEQSYGVGIPIILYFDRRISDEAALEQSFQVTTSRPVTGAWYWDNNCNMAATCAYFRPQDYWPAGTTVRFTGHLDGVRAGPGVYGHHTLTQTFRIGQSVVAVGSPKTHRTQIYVGGHLKYNWPISTGKPGDDTPNGSYLTIEKENPVRMKGPGYNLLVPWSVRFTYSGDYYHDAYWSTSDQGFENVSHGCVNLSPSHAKTYYELAVPGDPITIWGSPKAGVWGNGWTMWFLSWQQYLKGSALHEAVRAGPGGSAFVNPSTLPPDTAKAPLQTASANNAAG